MLKFIDNYPLKNVTALQIGGPAKKFVRVKTHEELTEAIRFAHDQNLPFLVIGRGSNLLVSDQGVDSLVIQNEIAGIETQNLTVKVKSGTLLQDLVNYTILQGLRGLQKLAGIPGTVGGAVYGNAGAYGQTISDHLISVSALDNNLTINRGTIFSQSSKIKQYNNSDCAFDYRESIFKRTHDIILEVIFQLEPGDPKALADDAKCILSKRENKYPPGIKCPGSFFKNLIASKIPPEILKNIPQDKIVYGKLPAGALLESVGAKGQQLDGIAIASYHANLFINTGKGTAQSFCQLAKTYQQKVKEKFGITLEPEVQLINLPPLV